MDTIWAHAVFPAEYTVLGLRLRHYCAGHEINLCQIQSPFVLGGESDYQDFCTAVLLCSQTFEQGRELIRRPGKSRVFIWLWKWFLKRFDFHVEHLKFRGYLNVGSWSPETCKVIAKGVEMRTLKAPRAYRLVPFLCAHLGLTETQALNFPLSRANAYYAAQADKAGEIDLAGGDEDEALVAHLRNLEAREAAGEKVWD